MNVRLLLPVLFLGLGFSPLFAQQFVPLSGYDFPDNSLPAPLTPKVNCGDFGLDAYELFEAGESRTIKLDLDTIGLGPGITYSCEGCAEAAFGTAVFANDTLTYSADAGAEEGVDELSFTACNAAGECAIVIPLSILVRRDSRTIDLGNRIVLPGGVVEVGVPREMLPSEAICRTIETCATDYAGREQRVAFLEGMDRGNDFRYVAARAGGEDAVCVTVCTAFGLCDVYRATFTIDREAVDLPFFDDFSYNDFRPAANLWQNEDVLINRNFAVGPPSIGVATFDAVDFDGKPYASGSSTPVPRDYLTSTPINMAGQSGVNLHFQLQPRGLGNRPERQDSFLVQFLSPEGNWSTALRIEGVPITTGNNTPLPFESYTLTIPDEMLYNGFQFRFANKSSEVGAVDMWHLDYVRLDAEQNPPRDLALQAEAFYLTEPYTAIPMRHLQAGGEALFRDSITLILENLSAGATDDITVDNGLSRLRVQGGSNDPITVAASPLLPSAFGTGGSGDNEFAPGQRLDRTILFSKLGKVYTDIVGYLLTVADENLTHKLETIYLFNNNGETSGAYEPGITDNNFSSVTTCFGEYMAYDDGTAEVTLEGQSGTTILQEYNAFVDDQLTGIQVRIPRGLGGLGDQDIRLVVYSGDTMPTDLIYSEDFPILYAEDFHLDSLQGYTTYTFDAPVDLITGAFWVGWEQQSASRSIGVGFDRNNSPEEVQWFDVGNGFQRLGGTTTGAIMLRPLLAGFAGFQTNTDDPAQQEPLIEVFPNPTNGTLHLRPRQLSATQVLRYRLFSFSGALLREVSNADRLELGDLPAGIYLLEASDGTRWSHHKIVRR
ncbi:T9SS type A sorting domain-containing protein [Neolewinella agarilytica]|uniref:Por secretion system C-terminal sorting domain-containing protein n=1 Tax=Neolewinella agarilytica TaxID=478744 RepID=A0A1H9FET3_9BACT|nr:T9SS type A sorting domain-containing protein [Neolewinella agarilytica]SEQ35973.1 Por secretion system C-terminal sorting domain-containing protein [Neolewinella agarilytica]